MRKRVPVMIGIILTILLAVWYGNTNKTHKIYDNNVNTAEYLAIGVLTEGQTVTQSFVCQEDVLDGFMIKSDVLGDYEDAVVTIRVRDAETGELLSEGQEKGSDIRARRLHYYQIPAITGCRDRHLVVEVSEEGTSANNGINLFYQPGGLEGEAFTVSGNATEGVFVMKTVTERFDVETFLVMLFAEWFIWVFLWVLYRLFR